MHLSRWALGPVLMIGALAAASCSSSVPGSATSGFDSLRSDLDSRTANTADAAEWGRVGDMGQGRPEFPESRDDYSLTIEWDTQSRAFENTVTLIGNSTRNGQFKPTMNGCNATDYLVRWRTVADGRTVTAYSVDSIGDTHGSVTGSNGWMRLDGCHVPGFQFDSADDPSNLADVTVTVQAWRPTA